ncbi:cysteine methyltransferase [Candidatus Saccharibacteria bacterium]|nr:cysteine methyltransferase [Candidatus Saccharibacteria bacterium]
MKLNESNRTSFKSLVNKIVAKIPYGMVMTYGDVAILAGQPLAARVVGGIAHFGDTNLPWHRVVNRFGDCASGYPGGKDGHKQVLEAEGFEVKNYRIVDFVERRWWPEGDLDG